ncbi:MAG: hypothetical protein ACLPTQ_16925 [Terriglobales bacterium]
MKKKSKEKVVASCKIPPSTKKNLERMAARQGKTVSEVLSRIVEEYEEPSTDELEERAKLVAGICAGLKQIEEYGYDENDLEAMDRLLSGICAGLKEIEESGYDENDLEAMGKQVAEICAGLKVIEESEVEVG